MNFVSSIWSSFLSQVFLFSFLAMAGGIVLFIGLWKEWKGHKDGLDKTDWHSEIDDFRKSKRKSKSGQIWVMAGVAVEIVLAVGVAIYGVCEKWKTDKQIGKLSPREFNAAQTQKAAAILKQYAGKQVSVRWIEEDGETDAFAKGLSNLLANAGCRVGMDEGWVVRGSGIDIETRLTNDIAFSQTLAAFLKNDCNLPTQQRNTSAANPPNPDADVIITVGFKGQSVALWRSLKLDGIPIK